MNPPCVSLRSSLLILVLAGSCPSLAYDNEDASGHVFSGGMIFHQGISFAENEYQEMNGRIGGLGGRLHIEGIPYFRPGFTGARSDLVYDPTGSYLRMGYGAAMLELWYQIDRFKGSVGVFGGRGGIESLHVIRENEDRTITADFREHPTWVYGPTLTHEYFITDRFVFTLMVDYLLGTDIGTNNHYGLRFFAGILFYR